MIGPALFEQNVIVYLTIVLVIAVHLAPLPHPVGPADAVGRRAPDRGRHGRAFVCWPCRYRNVIVGGMIAGFGGAFFTVGSTSTSART